MICIGNSMHEAVSHDDKKDIIFRLKKLRTEADDALHQYEQLDNLKEARDILGYLHKDAKSLQDDINKMIKSSRLNESLDSGYFIEYLLGDGEERTRSTLVVSAKDEKDAITKAKKYLDKKYNNAKTYEKISQVKVDTSRGDGGKCDSIKKWKKDYPHSNFDVVNESLDESVSDTIKEIVAAVDKVGRPGVVLVCEHDEDYSIHCSKSDLAEQLKLLNASNFTKGTIRYSLGSFTGQIEVPVRYKQTQTITSKFNVLVPR